MSVSLKTTLVQLLSRAPMSLADMQTATQVSLPTLRRELQALSRAGWVRQVGQTGSTGGRPAVLYGLDSDTHLIAGVHLELPAVNLLVAGLDGRVVDFMHRPGQEVLSPDIALRTIREFVRAIRTAYPKRQLLGVGIAMPGFVDPDSGEVLNIGRAPGWEHFPLQVRLEAELGLPVVVENDIDCMTFAELAHSELPEATDMVYLGFSEGVKATMVLGGRLYKGPFGNAGIIGRTILTPNDDGRSDYQYLEEVASIGGVCTEFDARVRAMDEAGELLEKMATEKDRTLKFQAILEAAAKEEPLSCELVQEVLNVLAISVANLIYIIQPGLLVIGGALSNLPPALRPAFESRIRSKLPSLVSNHLVIKYASMTDARVAATGAVYRFLQRYPVEEAIPEGK